MAGIGGNHFIHAARRNVDLTVICVNNFNYAPYLAQAIESALSQSYPDVEVLVVDDGSTDESRDIIASVEVSAVPSAGIVKLR